MTPPLWAPWRMEYILGERHTECIFCDFASLHNHAMRDKLVLLVQPHAVVALNRYPFTTCHLLVSPRRHVSDLTELDPVEYTALMELLRLSVIRLRNATGAQGINVGFNLGKAAGAGIADHTHGHLVPRWLGDTNFMPVLADVRVMPEYLDDAWSKLHPFFADLAGERAPAP